MIGAFVYFSFIDKKADIGAFADLLRYNDKWGSGRGKIWRRMGEIYHELPWYRKLIGAGEESVAALIQQYFPKQAASAKTTLDSAHNEFLQYLVTHGLLGLAAYVLFVVSAVKRGFREGGVYQRAAAIAAVGFLAQSTVNITQVLTTPLLFVFLALTQTRALALPPAEQAAAEEAPAAGENAADTATVPEAAPVADAPVS